jgi:DNA helicase-2/ATP-dependent DNA helicase PcrA
VLIERISHLIETDTPPWSVIAVTFTNKAADEMRERLAVRVGKARASQVWMGTFHAFGALMLRQFGQMVGFYDGFSIYDDEDRLDVFKLCAHEMGLKITAKEPTIEGIEGTAKKAGKFPLLRSLYDAKLRQFAATDYDGLETHMLALLASPTVVAHMQRYREILVDEYQDTNDVQEAILAALRGAVAALRIFAVGDPMQSLYSFRGAKIENIINAAQRPGMRVIRLGVNYRSCLEVVGAGNRIAAAGGSPIGRIEAGPAAKPGSIGLDGHATAATRAQSIAFIIRSQVNDLGDAPSDIMVLARTWKALAAVEAELVALGIPCEYPKREADAWTTTAMRWMVAAMRLHRNPRDGIALRRVLRWPTAAASEAQITRAEVRGAGSAVAELRVDGNLRIPAIDPDGFDGTAAGYASKFTTTSEAWDMLIECDLVSQHDELDAANVRLRAWCDRRMADDQPNDVKAFLNWYAFRDVRDADAPTPESSGKVRLLTIHAAKGLEAPVVHFVGPDRGVFPRKGEDPRGEELRLWYVAVTRARDVFVAHTADEVDGWGEFPVKAGASEFVEYLRVS